MKLSRKWMLGRAIQFVPLISALSFMVRLGNSFAETSTTYYVGDESVSHKELIGERHIRSLTEIPDLFGLPGVNSRIILEKENSVRAALGTELKVMPINPLTSDADYCIVRMSHGLLDPETIIHCYKASAEKVEVRSFSSYDSNHGGEPAFKIEDLTNGSFESADQIRTSLFSRNILELWDLFTVIVFFAGPIWFIVGGKIAAKN